MRVKTGVQDLGDRYEDDERWHSAMVAIHDANPEAVLQVLGAPEDDLDGRSQWLWIRFPNGDLVLGVFPQGETYSAIEVDAEFREEVES